MIATDRTSPERTPLVRLRRFARRPWPEKVLILGFYGRRILQVFPRPVYSPAGVWWLTWGDALANGILNGSFESVERAFVEDFLRPGMTVLDIGAHHGLYTLIASRCVGPRGRVIAFEPSPRERRKLSLHVRLNVCRNVQIEGLALGQVDGEANFFLVNSRETGCNSLRPPAVEAPTKVFRVRVTRLDDFLQAQHVERVDFVKMDVEGGELAVLKGARQLLERRPRPVMLVEVSDLRTEPWGYRAREVLSFLRERGYHWFQPVWAGHVEAVSLGREGFDNNFVAFPEERLDEIGHLREPDEVQACPSFA